MEACYGGTDVMERSCAVARGIDINRKFQQFEVDIVAETEHHRGSEVGFGRSRSS
jgi:hypothetical protein